MSVQKMIAVALVERQLRPDQVEWLQKYKNTPQEVLLQFFLSPKGAKVLQASCDSLMVYVTELEKEIVEQQKKQPG